MNLSQRFQSIRAVYAMALPEWMDEYERTGNMFHDPYLMDWDMSPIERNVWGDIRDMCLPFYPQMPALNYFLDFGNPFLKIGIECDGKEWHDAERDRERDARLARAGWMIFRLKGHECVRQVSIHRDCSDEEITPRELERHYGATSEGVLRAIKAKYFSDDARDSCLIRGAIRSHLSTPETNPARRPVARSGRPRGMDELMDEHWQLMMTRLERAKGMR